MFEFLPQEILFEIHNNLSCIQDIVNLHSANKILRNEIPYLYIWETKYKEDFGGPNPDNFFEGYSNACQFMDSYRFGYDFDFNQTQVLNAIDANLPLALRKLCQNVEAFLFSSKRTGLFRSLSKAFVESVEIIQEIVNIKNTYFSSNFEFAFLSSVYGLEDKLLSGNNPEIIELTLSMNFTMQEIVRPYKCNLKMLKHAYQLGVPIGSIIDRTWMQKLTKEEHAVADSELIELLSFLHEINAICMRSYNLSEMLLIAVESNNISVDIIQTLLLFGAEPSFCQVIDGETALFRALCLMDKKRSFKVFSLLYAHASISTEVKLIFVPLALKHEYWNGLLHLLITGNESNSFYEELYKVGTLSTLLEETEDLEEKFKFFLSQPNFFLKREFSISLIHRLNNVSLIEQICKEGEIAIDIRDERGNTALHKAAESGDVTKVKTLLKLGANVNVLNEDQQTPLHYTNELEIVDLLVTAGADISVLMPPSSD